MRLHVRRVYKALCSHCFFENQPSTGQQDVDLYPWQESSSIWGRLKQDGFVCGIAFLPLPSFLSLSTYGRSLKLCIPGVPPRWIFFVGSTSNFRGTCSALEPKLLDQEHSDGLPHVMGSSQSAMV